MTRRQPLAARVWGSVHRTWFPPETRSRRAKKRSAKRERALARREIRDTVPE